MTVGGQPVGDGSISEEKLHQLLAMGGELDDLDFKEFLDPSDQKDKVELVKDFAAMQSISTGGYVIVGVDGSRAPSVRLGELDAAKFDPANLHRVAQPYLPAIRLRAAIHKVHGVTVALIYVGPPEPPGVPILVKDGQYALGAKNGSKTVFREGDVFVRRGTQSVRWAPGDLPAVLSRWEVRIREDERRRAREYAESVLAGERGRSIAAGPLGSLTWRLAAEEFEAGFLEALRSKDEVALQALALAFGADSATALVSLPTRTDADADADADLGLLLDRLTAALALTVTYDAEHLFEQLLSVLVDMYSAVVDSVGNPRPSNGSRSEMLMWRIVTAAAAVGGLAVRLSQWWAVRPLALGDAQLARQLGEPSWFRHAVTWGSRSRVLRTIATDGQVREIGGPVVSVARQLVERIPALRPDAHVSAFELNTAPESNDKVLDSLIQFDVLWCVAAVANSGNARDQYPSFAAFYGHRAIPVFEVLITDREVREQVLGEDVANLKAAVAEVVALAGRVALTERMAPWRADSQVLTEFLAG